MIIGIDASRANKPVKTGVEWYSYYLIQELKKLDSQNQYFLYTNKPLSEDLKKGPANFKEVILKWPIPRSWTIGRLSLEMKFGKHKPDLLFVPAHTLPLMTPKKSVVTVHDIGFEHLPQAYGWADKLYHKLIIKIIKRKATKIITVSNFSKEDIVQTYKIAADRIEVVYNGYDNEIYKVLENLGDDIFEKYKINGPFFLYIGRLENKKNINSLIEAFNLFKQNNPDSKHKLVLAGAPGYGKGYEQITNTIKRLQIQNDVLELGWVVNEDLPKLLNHADLFVFPSLFEGFGVPVVEAMACGCPVICSNTTSLPEAAGDSAIKFNPQKITAIAKAMQTVVRDESLRQALIQSGLQHCQNFSWKKCAQQTLAVLESIK